MEVSATPAPDEKLKSEDINKPEEPKIELIETAENKAAIQKMYEHNAELIYGKMRTFNNIKAAKNANKDDRKPFIVLLYGPPGSGKSSPTTQKVIHEELGLDTTNAVSISLDALVEGLEPFQRKSAELYRNKEKQYTNEQKQKLSQSLYGQSYKANKSGETIIDGKKIAEKDKKTLLKKRDDLLELIIALF